jgi:flagellar biogenesis protein FliO
MHITWYKSAKGGDIMEDLLKAIANLGFPMAVAAYLLIRIESKMNSLSASINQLSTILLVKLGNNDNDKAA